MSTDADKPIKIGCLMSNAGVPGEAGLRVEDAIKLYFEQIGHQVSGRRIECIFENDAESGYVSAMWIVKAIEALQSNVDNKKKLLEALYQVKLQNAPRGPISLDKYGNPIENVYVRQVERKNGKLQNTVIDTFQNISQFWKWDPAAYMKEPVYDRKNPPVRFGEAAVQSKP